MGRKRRCKMARRENLLKACLSKRKFLGLNSYRFEDTCLICRRRISPDALRHDGLSHNLNPGMSTWKVSLANSVCRMLGIEEKIICGRWFQKAVYCIRCTTLICDAEFLLKSLKDFKAKLDSVRVETQNLLIRNVEDILWRDSQGANQSSCVSARYGRAVRDITANLRESSQNLFGEFIPEMSPVSIEEEGDILSRQRLQVKDEKEDTLAVIMETKTLNSPGVMKTLNSPVDYPTGPRKSTLPIQRHLRLLKMRKRKHLQLSDPDDDTSVTYTASAFSVSVKNSDGAHFASHPVNLIDCNLCSLQFDEESLFRRHLVRMHSVKVDKQQSLRCRVCTHHHWCVSRKELEEHMRLLHSDNSFRVKCSICALFCATIQALDSHESLHNAKVSSLYPFACVLCDEDFCASVLLKHHVNEVHQTYLYCQETDCVFKTKSEMRLEQHTWSHKFPSGKDPYKCGECPFETRYASDFRAHERKQHRKKQKCPREGCAEEFLYPDTLIKHVKKIHDNIVLPRREVPCEICSRKFRDVGRMRNHMERHGDKRPYLCHLCPHAFKTSSTLRNHLNTHKLKPPGASMNHSKPRKGRLSSAPMCLPQRTGQNANASFSCNTSSDERKLSSADS